MHPEPVPMARPASGSRVHALTLITWVLVLMTLTPLLWLLSTSLRTSAQAFSGELFVAPTAENFLRVAGQTDFLLTYVNSLVVVCCTTALTLAFGVTAGYALARTTGRFARALGGWIIVIRMVPPMAFALPFFLMFRQLSLLDTYGALILVYLTITLPFCTWLMAGYFQGLPIELEEAARIDGCSRISALLKVTLPSAMPGIATAATFSFISAWNEFFYPLVIAGRTTKPASVAIQGFISSAGVDWGGLAAASLLVLAPVLVFSFITQRGLVTGLTAGSVK